MDGMSWSDSSDKNDALHLIVSGRVQGVGFRAWAARDADRLGIKGLVRNLPDGSVEIVAEGAPELLDRFYERLEAGNGYSRTDQLQKKRVSPQGFTRFSITY